MTTIDQTPDPKLNQYEEEEESTERHAASRDLPLETYADDDEITRPVKP